MNEYLLAAHEELKRLEHIIYVSLKYTRTVDVIINALNRLVNIFDIIIEGFLIKFQEEGKIESIPKSPALRSLKLSKFFEDDKNFQCYLSFYTFLKNVLKAPHKKREEYRRHVTLIADLGNHTAEIKIDNLTNCEKFVHKFFKYSISLLEPKE